MGVPCARAVLRALLAARRKARPTANVRCDGFFLVPFLFMGLAPIRGAYCLNYHTLSIHRLKAGTRSENYSSFE
jgi:hypothetical protein